MEYKSYDGSIYYFGIALILAKTDNAKSNILRCLFEQFGLSEGRCNSNYFDYREVTVINIDDNEDCDYSVIIIDLPHQVFHRENFDKELSLFTNFAKFCFNCSKELHFITCSWLSIFHYLDEITRLEDITDAILNKLPIYYKKGKNKDDILVGLNHKSENTFLDSD